MDYLADLGCDLKFLKHKYSELLTFLATAPFKVKPKKKIETVPFDIIQNPEMANISHMIHIHSTLQYWSDRCKNSLQESPLR